MDDMEKLRENAKALKTKQKNEGRARQPGMTAEGLYYPDKRFLSQRDKKRFIVDKFLEVFPNAGEYEEVTKIESISPEEREEFSKIVAQNLDITFDPERLSDFVPYDCLWHKTKKTVKIPDPRLMPGDSINKWKFKEEFNISSSGHGGLVDPEGLPPLTPLHFLRESIRLMNHPGMKAPQPKFVLYDFIFPAMDKFLKTRAARKFKKFVDRSRAPSKRISRKAKQKAKKKAARLAQNLPQKDVKELIDSRPLIYQRREIYAHKAGQDFTREEYEDLMTYKPYFFDTAPSRLETEWKPIPDHYTREDKNQARLPWTEEELVTIDQYRYLNPEPKFDQKSWIKNRLNHEEAWRKASLPWLRKFTIGPDDFFSDMDVYKVHLRRHEVFQGYVNIKLLNPGMSLRTFFRDGIQIQGMNNRFVRLGYSLFPKNDFIIDRAIRLGNHKLNLSQLPPKKEKRRAKKKAEADRRLLRDYNRAGR
jgi:hypothetical protein